MGSPEERSNTLSLFDQGSQSLRVGTSHITAITNSQERLRIENNGLVFVNDGLSFHVGADNQNSIRLHHINNNCYLDYGLGSLEIRHSTATGIDNITMSFLANGNVGIGNTDSTHKLSINQQDSSKAMIHTIGKYTATGSTYGYQPILVHTSGGPTSYNNISAEIGITPVYNGAWVEGPAARMSFKLNSTAGDSNSWGWAANTEVMTLNGWGNVGIGTTNPTAALHVLGFTGYSTPGIIARFRSNISQSGNKDVGLDFQINNNDATGGTSSGSYAAIQSLMDNVAYTPLILNPTAGNVGIGTNNPVTNLHVFGTGESSYPTISIGSDQSVGLIGITYITAANGGVIGSQVGDMMIDAAATVGDGKKVHICRNSEYKAVMTVVNTGNVGIGTTNPICSLNVVNDGGWFGRIENKTTNASYYSMFSLANDSDTGGGCYLFLNSTARTEDGGANNATLRNDRGDLILASRGSQGMRIVKDSGNVGIGTTNPAAKLHIDEPNLDLWSNLLLGPGISQTQKSPSSQVATPNSIISGFGDAGGQWLSGRDMYICSGETIHDYWNINAYGGDVIIRANALRSRQNNGTAAATEKGGHIYIDSGAIVRRTDAGNTPGPGSHPGNIYLRTGHHYTVNSFSDVDNQAVDWTTRMIVSGQTGNVGIGTTDPKARLHIARPLTTGSWPVLNSYSGSILAITGDTGYGLNIGVERDTGSSYIQSQRFENGDQAHSLLLQPSGGNVGIGTTNPEAKLHINGNLYIGGPISLNAPSGLGSQGGFIVTKQVRINQDATVIPAPAQVFENVMNVTRMGSLLHISGMYAIRSNSSTYTIRFTNRLGFTDCNAAFLVWGGSYVTSCSVDESANNWLVLELSNIPSSDIQYLHINCLMALGFVYAY